MRKRFITADVFTDRIFGGNPLAVIPDGTGLSTAQMQSVAKEFNLSETVFVLPAKSGDANAVQLRIFTPARELPFAGHPTVGAAIVLATTGAIKIANKDGDTKIVCEEGVGPVLVTIRCENGKPVFATLSAAKMPEFGPPLPAPAELAKMLGIKESDIRNDDELSSQSVSCGVPFIVIPLTTTDAVSRAELDPTIFKSLLKDYWARDVYPFGPAAPESGANWRVRLFAPLLGVPEDPATGSAAAVLGGYLATRDMKPNGNYRWILEQGIEMGRPSRLEVEAEKKDGKVIAIRVGGSAVLVSEGEIEIPQL